MRHVPVGVSLSVLVLCCVALVTPPTREDEHVELIRHVERHSGPISSEGEEIHGPIFLALEPQLTDRPGVAVNDVGVADRWIEPGAERLLGRLFPLPAPDETVTMEIKGFLFVEDEILEAVEALTDGTSFWMSSATSGDVMTVRLSPVANVQAFCQRINFGKVTDVEGRTIQIKFGE